MTANHTIEPIVFRMGKSVVLSPLCKEHIPELHKFMNDPEVTQYLRRSFPLSLIEEENWFNSRAQNDQSNVILGMHLKDGTFIGTMALHKINWIDRTATTGTCIGNKEHQGKGYGTDAKMILLEYAFQTLGLRKICSSAIAFNSRSIGFNTHCGYKVEGVLKNQIYRHGEYHDEVLLAVFKEDWLPLWEQYSKE